MNKKQKLHELIEKLIALGEDKDELWFWQEYFQIMKEENQDRLLLDLEKEVQDLEALKK